MDMTYKPKCLALAACTLALAFSSGAYAEVIPGEEGTSQESLLSQDELNAARGGDFDVNNTVVAAQDLKSTVRGAPILVGGDATNGRISLDVSGFHGVGGFASNSGNNASIQLGVNLSVNLR